MKYIKLLSLTKTLPPARDKPRNPTEKVLCEDY